MKVTIDLASCQGYACCMMEAPELFDLDEEAGKAVLLDPDPPQELWAKAEAAVRACPAKAIRVENA